MDSEKRKFDWSKMVTTWWDLIDHYLLAVVLAVSVALVGLQTSQDRLICIPAVHCSDLPRNDSVMHKCREFSNVLDTCNRSSSLVVLTTMSDRRQYDYIDSECYKKMQRFSAYYSLIFLVEAVILFAISSFWHRCPNSANALLNCEHLLSEYMMEGPTKEGITLEQDEQIQREGQNQEKKLKIFDKYYNNRISKYNLNTVTGQYRLRGGAGSFVTIVVLVLNICYYSHSTSFTQCHLDGHVPFSATHRFFQCSRPMEMYFQASSILINVLFAFHFAFVFGSFLWSVTGERLGPDYKFIKLDTSPDRLDDGAFVTLKGDAAFLFHLIFHSNYGHRVRSWYEEEQLRKKRR